MVDRPGPVPDDRIFVITQLADRDAGTGEQGSRDRRGILVRQFGAVTGRGWPPELRQQFGGLVGALVVLEPGERWEPERDLIFLLSDGASPRMFINGSLAPAPKELEVGTTYRLRIADIAVFRPGLSVRLLRDSTLVQWRPIAKDGFALPPARATLRPSIADVPSGETADFEFTPEGPGDLLLVVGPLGGAPQGSVRLRVSRRR